MKLRDLCKLVVHGAADLESLASRGDLTSDQVWVAAKGAAKYVRAVASGDIAPADVVCSRRAACAACISRQGEYCGPMFVDLTSSALPTCGCLVEGKTAVASEACPQGRWGAVTGTG